MTINPMNFDETELVQGIREWVEMESPTTEPEAVNQLMDLVESQLRATGAEYVEVVAVMKFLSHRS
ncbi:MAG: hypothetical protein O7B79_01500 [SAR324 cluster bacterium]|nr:hypothetical protein [SAR324 cluster bacterium]